MAAALSLKKRGIQSIIYETREESYTSGGNIALAPNALRVLDHLGIFETIRIQGFNYDEVNFTNGSGITLGKFLNGSQKIYYYQALRIHRTVVRDALRLECANSGIQICYHKKCTDVHEAGNKVTATFADGETVTADFLIGADGIHSKVRQHLAPNAEPPSFSGLMGVMGTVMASELEGLSHPDLPAMLFGATGSFAIMPASYSGDEVGYFATIEANDRSQEEWDKLGHDKNALQKMMMTRYVGSNSKWPPYVQALIEKTSAGSLTSWP